MTSQTASVASPIPAQQLLDPADRDVFAEMFDAHARHLFDYCCGLLGDRARAASATQVTLIAAHSLVGQLTDRTRMRAWLLALGRRECLDGGRPADSDGDLVEALAVVGETDVDVAQPDSGELAAAAIEAAGHSVREQWRELPADDREILDVLFRHGVGEADLPAVLQISAAVAADRLTAAKARFCAAVAEADAAAADSAADVAADADAEPDLETPDAEIPDPETPDPETPDPETPDPETPDPETPDPETAAAETAAAETAAAETGVGPADAEAEPDAEAEDAAPDPEPATVAVVTAAADGPSALERLAALPLVTLPASIWRRTARSVLDPRFRYARDAVSGRAGRLGPDGFPAAEPEEGATPSSKKLLMASAVLAALLLAPVAAGAAGYAEFAGVAHAVSHTHGGKSFTPAGGPTSVSSSPSVSPARGHHKGRPSARNSLAPQPSVGAGIPVPGTSTSPKPKPSGSPSHFSPPASSSPPVSSPPPSSPPPTSTPTPTPSSTPSGTPSNIDLAVLLGLGQALRHLQLP